MSYGFRKWSELIGDAQLVSFVIFVIIVGTSLIVASSLL